MKIHVDGREIAIKTVDQEDYISLTDMVEKRSSAGRIIARWLRNKNTLEFLGIWEELYNPNFKLPEFGELLNQSGTNRFDISVNEWTQQTSAVGLMSKQGRNGGTFAHRDIAFEFGAWISPKFKLLLIREFQRLKTEEAKQLNQEWNYSRYLSKINYGIQTEMINRNILPRLEKGDKPFAFSSEADLLNVAVFGMSAKEFREQYPKAKGNLRDNATIQQLTVLANLESINAHLIESGASQGARFNQLIKIAVYQLEILSEDRRLEE